MRYPYFLIVCGLFMLVFASFTAATSVDIEPVNKSSHEIFFDQTATFDLTIDNTMNESRVFSLSLRSLNWIIDSYNSFFVDSDTEKTFELRIRPRPSNFRGPGLYSIPYEMTTTDGFSQSNNINIAIKNAKERAFEYKPSVALGLSLDEKINPKEEFSVQASLRNRNLKEFDALTFMIDGEHFSKEKVFSLSSLEERSFAFKFDVADDTSPGTYSLTAEVVYGNETISSVERYYEIGSYADIDRDSVSRGSSWLKTTQVSTITNTGNVEKSVVTDLDVSFFENIFTDVTVEASSVDQQGRNSWKLNLDPQETATITIVNNYRPLGILVVLIVLGVVAYFVFRTPIVLKKQVIVTGKDDEGVSEMKVRVYIRNRTSKAFYNIRVLDKAPAIAQVSKSNTMGSIDPTKIVTTENKGTVVKWDFDSLEAFEERIVTYKIRACLKIIGNLGLPKVKVRFENDKGRVRTTESDKARIGATS